MKIKKNIYYIAELDFEKSNASTARVINNIKSLKMNSNINVTIIGYGNTPALSVEGINVVNLPKGNSNIIKFLHYIFRSIDIFLAIKNLDKKPDTIIYYGSHSRYLIPLLVLRKTIKFSLFSSTVHQCRRLILSYSRVSLKSWWMLCGPKGKR